MNLVFYRRPENPTHFMTMMLSLRHPQIIRSGKCPYMVWYQSTSVPVGSPPNSSVCWTTSARGVWSSCLRYVYLKRSNHQTSRFWDISTSLMATPPPDLHHVEPRLLGEASTRAKGANWNCKPANQKHAFSPCISAVLPVQVSVISDGVEWFHVLLCLTELLKDRKDEKKKKNLFWSRPTAVSFRGIAHLILWCFAFHVRFTSVFVIHLCESEPAGSPRRPKRPTIKQNSMTTEGQVSADDLTPKVRGFGYNRHRENK